MDPVSQAALGAVVGQAVGHRQLGYRAAAVGALAGALPDIDVLFSVTGDYFDQLVSHRGITHSLLFAPVVGPPLALLVNRLDARRRDHGPPARARRRAWLWVVSLALLSHPLLDLLTPYGTQLLQPFSDARFAINAMPIIDPIYTSVLLLGLLLAWRPLSARAGAVALATLGISTGYLGYGWYLNTAAEREAARQLAAADIPVTEVAAFPTILQVHYRRVVARGDNEDRAGFLSMWRPCDIQWTTAPSNERSLPAIRELLASREGSIFDWFTMGWGRYRITGAGSAARVVGTDLRYGITADPDSSIFTVSAPLDGSGSLAAPASAGRQFDADAGSRLAGLFDDAYGGRCSLTR